MPGRRYNPDTPSAPRDATTDRSAPDGCARPHSFVPGTRVVLADGSSKPIEQLQVGDRVLATDVESGDNQVRVVTDVRSHTGDKDLVTVTVDTDGDNGTQTGSFTATADHPIWLPAGTWAPAGQLQPGMWLQTGAGTWVQVTAVQHHHAGHQQVHNLTVTGVHTYYILAGSAPVLVHNVNRPDQCTLLFPGPNAKNGVPVSEFGEISPAERAATQEEGDIYGCHSCGADTPGRESKLWTPDHQPITSLVPEGTPQMLYPHCATCQRRQGNLAMKLLTGRNPSGWRPTPLGLIVPKPLAESGWVKTASGLLIPG